MLRFEIDFPISGLKKYISLSHTTRDMIFVLTSKQQKISRAGNFFHQEKVITPCRFCHDDQNQQNILNPFAYQV